jgi:phosphocarrier protein HPr
LIEKEITVINKLGLHARPAAQLVKTTSRFKSEVSIRRDSLTVNAKSIMGVMMLAAELGAVLKFRIEGEDEKQAMDAIEKVFQSKFGED